MEDYKKSYVHVRPEPKNKMPKYRLKECPMCKGDGYIDDEYHMPDRCSLCDGEGAIYANKRNYPNI